MNYGTPVIVISSAEILPGMHHLSCTHICPHIQIDGNNVLLFP